MNTTKKGNEFEQRVLAVFSDLLARGLLSNNPKNSKIFSKKRYYSRDRQDYVTVDISIESYTAGRENYSQLTIIECKDYSTRPVPVNDIEEFQTKLNQIGASKGIVISSNIFDPGAFRVAQANQIGLGRLLPDSELQWVLDRATSGSITHGHKQIFKETMFKILVDGTSASNCFNFAGFFDGQVTHSMVELFNMVHLYHSPNLKQDHGKQVPYLEKEVIGARSTRILERISFSGEETPLQEILTRLREKGLMNFEYRDTLGCNKFGHKILARLSFEPTVMYIGKDSEGMYSERFSIAHELGHFFLRHDRYMKSDSYSSNQFDSMGHEELLLESIKTMEWQANYFASNLLVPRYKLRTAFYEAANVLSINIQRRGGLYVDNQRCNLHNFYRLTDLLTQRFRVSRAVIAIALKDMGFLEDQRRTPTASSRIISGLLTSLRSSKHKAGI